MISVKLEGRLGNNMFQIACLIGQALKCNDDYILPKWKYSGYFDVYKERGDNTKTFSKFYQEPFYHYQEIKCLGDVELRGYFQSEKYFNHCIPIIRDTLTPNTFIQEYVQRNRPKGTCTGVHIRRDDYLKFEHYYYILGQEHLTKALGLIKTSGKLLVFSDDIPWCKENIPADYYGSGDPVEDLFLLSSCDNIVMSNSTFTWWAQWLNNNPDKIVIAPAKDRWFKPLAGHKVDDLYMDNWILV